MSRHFYAYIRSVSFESFEKLPQLCKKTDVVIMAIIGGILKGAIDDVVVTVVLMLEVPKSLSSNYCLNMAYILGLMIQKMMPHDKINDRITERRNIDEFCKEEIAGLKVKK